MRLQNCLKQLRARPLHWEMAVADFLMAFETWQALETFDNPEWIWRHSVERCWRKCAIVVREARKKGRRGNKRPATDFAGYAGKPERSNLPELPNSTFLVSEVSSAERQQWPDMLHAAPSFIHRCEVLGGANWFHRTKLWPKSTILSNCDIHVLQCPVFYVLNLSIDLNSLTLFKSN